MNESEFRNLTGWPFWWIGLAITLAYILLLSVGFGAVVSQLFGPGLSASELGDALSGIFAPLALIWLIVGLMQQGREIRIQVHELRESVNAQRANAEASGAQTRLQNEQFLERTYKLHRAACLDVLFHLLAIEHFMFQIDNRTKYVVDISAANHRLNSYITGSKYQVLELAKIVQGNLDQDKTLNEQFSTWLRGCRYKEQIFSLASDFCKFDELRLNSLSRFEGGDVLNRIDEHEGFLVARKLATGLANLLRP